MKSLLRFVAWSGLLLAPALPSALRAQGAAEIGPDHVVFYTEPNFKGEALKVEAGASVDNLGALQRPSQQPWTAAISSVQVVGAASASVYSAAGFRGERLEVTRNIPDLFAEPRGRETGATWDRTIVSVVVRAPTPATPPAPVVVAPAPIPAPAPVVPGRAETPPPTVVVVTPPPPPPRAVVIAPAPPRLDRRTAEMMVERAYREVLDRPADPEGMRRYRDRLLHEGWSERELVEQLQRSPEARAIKADEAITKIYREVLGRDPDPTGLAHYRAKWRQGWTQGQIRADLRRSFEGRDNRIRDTITRAYREVLGREPDPAGLANYERLMRERGYTERDIRRALMSGDEYRQRMRK